MASEQIYIDGDFSRPSPVGAPRYVYPFRELLDRVSAYFEQDYWQTQATFVPMELGTPHDTYPDFYLVIETEPKPIGGNVYSFTRTYARVPTNQVTYSSRSLTKPNISNQWSNTVTIRDPSNTGTELATAVRNNTGFWSTDNKVYSPFVATSTPIYQAPYVTAVGNFTLTYKTSTTGPIANGATTATIAAALNGLASVIADGLTYVCDANNLNLNTGAGGYIQLRLSAGTTTTPVTMDASALTVSSGVPMALGYWDGNHNFLQIGIPITAAAHGYTANSPLLVVTGYTGYGTNLVAGLTFTIGRWAVYDANTLIVSNYFNANGTIATYVARQLRTYTPGATILSTRVTQRFYLPGVTAGITTPADIPVTAPSISDQAVIAAVLGNGTYTAVDFQGPSQWLASAVWATVTTELNFQLIT